ncbi:hypothetical protein J4227_07855 [Candidatus Woesearchaeota archaeon]|nr:hypothetical protein [Candidatus Woesearchaeota archaeon]
MVTGRCMKCKQQVEMQNPTERITKNGMKMMQGKCPKCGTKVSRIMGKA